MMTVLTQRALKLAALSFVKGRKQIFRNKLPKRDIYYFGYAANLSMDRFKKYDMNVESIGVAKLQNHQLRFSLPCEYLGKGFASADPAPGHEVWGILYKMDRLSLLLLDIMEWAVLNQYRRVLVAVEIRDGGKYDAYTYQARYAREGLVPATDYKESILVNAKGLGFPQNYIQKIEAHPSRERFDLDPGFSLMFPNKRRWAEGPLRGVYLQHDRVREKVCEWLRF